MEILDEKIKIKIINQFNNNKIEPSYENLIYKKVCNCDIFLAIPDGIKCFLWFTFFENKKVCFLIELKTANKEINKISLLSISFDISLCLNSIFYGTLIYKQNDLKKFILLEDIFYYKGNNISFLNFNEKLNIFKILFNNDIFQYVFNLKTSIVGLPLLNTDFNILMNEIKNNIKQYKIKYICFRFFNNSKKCLFLNYNCNIHQNHQNQEKSFFNNNKINRITKYKKYKEENEVFFIVKATVKTDIYNLFAVDHKGLEIFFDIAYIPDFKTSVMMNGLFRNIKENNNLDLLEESDDEEDFEDITLNKYVFLDKKYIMSCIYDYKFKRFIPKKIINNNELNKIVSYDSIIHKKNNN